LENAVEAWSWPKCFWLQLHLMLLPLAQQQQQLRCMWHVAVDTRNYCHWAWLGFLVFQFWGLAVCLLLLSLHFLAFSG